MSNISVIGAGAWGTALAQVIASRNEDVCIWTLEQSHAEQINATQRNDLFLSGQAISDKITATSDLKTALQSDIILLVTPAQFVRSTIEKMRPDIRKDHKIILCSKGIEIASGKLMSQVAKEILPDTPIAVLSGPNFAREVAAGKPTATTLACEDNEIAETLQKAVASAYFRPYISNDIIGAQIAGSMKNVIAIACGMAQGLDMGDSARASLVTRGLAEIARLGVAMGGKYETFLGLCGVGDIMLTCSSEQSRNFSLGLAMGQGMDLDKAMDTSKGVTEGVYTAQAGIRLAKRHNVDMPITTAIHNCIENNLPLEDALKEMMSRPLAHEF